MATRRILLTGAGGQLGTDVLAAAEPLDDIDLIGLTRAQLDVTDEASVRRIVGDIAPDVLVHAGAYTAVDACETNVELAMDVNTNGTANIARAAESAGAHLMYISTDYVFDGTKPTPYLESDAPSPASVYGRSKLGGEHAVGPGGLIVRTSWVCGSHGANMVKTILRIAQQHQTLTFVDDQVGKPTFTSDLAAAVVELARDEHTGVMHVTNEGVVSWYDFCRDVLEAAGLDPERVHPCATDELDPPRPAPRPANSVLANTRFSGIGMTLLRDFRAPLAETVADLTK
ncbi:MAG: dTDP-4-dehydrorhamnose reductase [Acidimicrobiales bacterium]